MVNNNLKKIRSKNKLTCRDMSEKLGISNPFYCQIENGTRRLSYDMAFKIAKIFKKRPDSLFYEERLNEEQISQ